MKRNEHEIGQSGLQASSHLRQSNPWQVSFFNDSIDSKPSGNLTRLDWQTFDSSRQSAALREGVKLVATVGARQDCNF